MNDRYEDNLKELFERFISAEDAQRCTEDIIRVERILKVGSGPVELVQGPIISAKVWNSDNVAADDRNLVILTTELDEIEMEVMTLELGENGGSTRSAISGLEMDFAGIR